MFLFRKERLKMKVDNVSIILILFYLCLFAKFYVKGPFSQILSIQTEIC